jgi:hypothetical protein
MSKLVSTFKSIVRWSLTVKIGGAAIGLFWFLQWIKNELLPAATEERLRLLNLLPHFPWYIWVIICLSVALVGTFEGVVRWNKNEIAPILGWPETLQNDASLLARRIRDFIAKFIADNGEMPKIVPTGDDNERIRMNGEVSGWCLRFTSLFRATLADDALNIIRRIRAEGVEVDFTIAGVIEQPTLTPHAVMLLSGLLMAAGLSITLKSKKIIEQQK